jgi:hypothetical protein
MAECFLLRGAYMFGLLPWKFLTRFAARRFGVLDPIPWMARMRKFSKPSEVQEPLELLRAGIIFHARGLVNAKAIQHNLDWVWPYWVERQFNPDDSSFVPRAFSFSHINLTHRNWTAVGQPDLAAYPIVDPRGLVTPLYDGWSLDFWIVTDSGRKLLPSKTNDSQTQQRLHLHPTLEVETRCRVDDLTVAQKTRVHSANGKAGLLVDVEGSSAESGWLIVAVRPYNPEGIQFIERIDHAAGSSSLRVNDHTTIDLGAAPAAMRMAHYADGDVYHDLSKGQQELDIKCEVGMATAAAIYRLDANESKHLSISVPLEGNPKSGASYSSKAWESALETTAALRIADPRMQFLYDAAVRTVLLLSADLIVPGPYTYRRFWFRDACLMLHALMAIDSSSRAARIIETFPSRQTARGYFESQQGEWDSNGQVLWIVARCAALTGAPISPEMDAALRKAVDWLAKKRLPADASAGVAGLLPAGFSAEHLGPNDHYYWDDFWAVGGLRAMAAYWQRAGNFRAAKTAGNLADGYSAAIENSIAAIPQKRSRGAIPAAPSRRMDAGAIGSMVADYPLQLFPPGESRLMKTADYLIEHCFHKGGFFQEMIHSGINAYLTLDLAQTLLRNGDPRFADLIRSVADLASPTGQWPEAIHPLTMGGCMGDGQHGWAAAEWIMMIRNCFVREEADRLIIGSGILPEWMEGGDEVNFGPTATAWGPVTVRLFNQQIQLDAKWRHQAPAVDIAVPGFSPIANPTPGIPHLLQKALP